MPQPPPRACLSPSWPPHFLGSALGRALPQEPGRGAGPLLASLLSLSIHCAPRASPTVLGATCRVVSAADGPLPAHFWTLLSPVIVPRAPCRPSAPPSTSPRPLPSLMPQPSGLCAPRALGIPCPCSFVRGGPGSVTCAALYGAVCKNKPVGILMVSVPSRSRRPGPAPLLGPAQEEGGGEGRGVQVGCCPPWTLGPFNTPLLFSCSLERVPTWTGRRRRLTARWTASGVAGPSPSNRSALLCPVAGERWR